MPLSQVDFKVLVTQLLIVKESCEHVVVVLLPYINSCLLPSSVSISFNTLLGFGAWCTPQFYFRSTHLCLLL